MQIQRVAAMLGMASVSLCMLSACGSGTPEFPGAENSYDLDAIETAYMQQKHSYVLHGSEGGNNFELDITRTPGGAGLLVGPSGTTTTQTMVIDLQEFENGTLIQSEKLTQYFLVNPFNFVLTYDNTTGQVTGFAGYSPLPTSATINQTGGLTFASIYTNTSYTTIVGSYTDTWRLVPTTSGVEFCIDASGSDTSGTFEEDDCALMDGAGNVIGLTITDTQNGVTFKWQ